MKLLVIGSGGREHALAWKLANSNKVTKVYVAPGNAGTNLEHKLENIPITDITKLIQFAKDNAIDFTLVGPELPLANGIVDQFQSHNLKIWGPTKYCAMLESSKVYAKNFMQKYKIPTAKYQTFYNLATATKYLYTEQFPIVIKADGLAAGKGVLVATNLNDALTFLNDIFKEQKFGKDAGSMVVIEECLFGVEASFITMIDGKNILLMASSEDHKRLLNDDQGPNTGGMGAYSPTPVITKELENRVIHEIIQPVIDGMRQEGHTYRGFLYAGLMIDQDGTPKTLEFNCRCGDPETQPIMLRLEDDLVDLILHGLAGNLDQIAPKWLDQFAVSVVLASDGYPDSPRKNDIITGLDIVAKMPDVKVFHSGTLYSNGNMFTNGGRVLSVVALGTDIKSARNKAYMAIEKIHFTGMQYRTDIASKIKQ